MRPGEQQPEQTPSYGLFQPHLSNQDSAVTGDPALRPDLALSFFDANQHLSHNIGVNADIRSSELSVPLSDVDAAIEDLRLAVNATSTTGEFDTEVVKELLREELRDGEGDNKPLTKGDEATTTALSRRGLFEKLRLSLGEPLTALGTETETAELKDVGLTRNGFLLGVVGVAAGVGVAIYGINKLLDSPINFRAPDIKDPFGTSPPDVTVEAMPETVEIRGTFEMLAIADVTMGVEVNGFKEGLGLDVFGVTDAEFKKDLWMRMALTSDNKQINDSLVVTKERTNDGEKVLGVRATLNAADIFMPHYDLFNFLNFVSLRPDDTPEERAKKIYEFATQNGKHYDESGGFDCGVCSVSSAELFNASILGAMYAVSLDGRQPDLVDRMTKRYQLNLQTQLAAQYGLPLDKVQIDIAYDEGTNPLAPPTPEEVKAIYQSRLDEIYQKYYENVTIEYQGQEQQVDIGKVVFEVKPELRYDDKNEPYAYLRLHGGAEITIKLGGITLEEDVRSMIIANIDEFEEKVVNNPNSGVTTVTVPEESQVVSTGTTQPVYGPAYNPQNSQPVTSTTRPVYGPPFPGNTTSTTQE